MKWDIPRFGVHVGLEPNGSNPRHSSIKWREKLSPITSDENERRQSLCWLNQWNSQKNAVLFISIWERGFVKWNLKREHSFARYADYPSLVHPIVWTRNTTMKTASTVLAASSRWILSRSRWVTSFLQHDLISRGSCTVWLAGISSSDECVLSARASLRTIRLLRHWAVSITMLTPLLILNHRIISCASCASSPLKMVTSLRWKSFMTGKDVMSRSVINASALLRRFPATHARRWLVAV